jgi:hypothetical protein
MNIDTAKASYVPLSRQISKELDLKFILVASIGMTMK